MPESRDRILRGGTGVTYSGQDSRNRRGFYVAPGSRNGAHGLNLYGSPFDGKENIPPGSSRFGRRQGGKRNSPLPSWYPRSPLRDITAVVNAIERTRTRQRAVSRLGRRNQESEDSSPSQLLPNPLTPEPSVSEPTLPIQDSPPASSQISPDTIATLESSPLPEISSLIDNAATNKFYEFSADPTVAIENSLLPCSHPSVNSSSIDDIAIKKSIELPSVSPAKIENSLIIDPIDVEKKLSDAIDEIEREVKARIKRRPAQKKPARCKAMSMR